MNPKHILLPTDLSELSLRPLERAPELFENRKVTLLHIVQNVPVMATSSPFAPALEDPSLRPRMEAARESLKELALAIPDSADVQMEVVTGTQSGKDVARYAEENDVDLLVISTHGRSGLRRFVLGSVAEVILRHSTVPVMVFPAKDHGAEEDDD